ncbi:MAG: DMT family transporter [Sulfitobacter sp.]
MSAQARGQLLGHLAMLVFSAGVAGSFSLGALIANDIAPTAFNAMRFLIAIVIVGAVALAGKGIPRSALAAPWRYAVLGGLFSVYFVLMFEGLKTAAPVSAAAVFTLVPMMSAVIAYFLLAQLTTRRMALALAIGGGGALWVIFRGDPAALLGFEIGRGEGIYFLGCISHAVYTPMVRRLNRGESPLIFTLFTLIGAGAAVTLYGWPAILATDWLHLPGLVWITLGYVAAVATALTIVLLQFAALRLPSAKVMAYTYLVPSWVILWELALGNAPPPGLVLGGVALTILALSLLLRDETAQL